MDLFYRERGEGEPVILLHGLFGSNDNQGGLARALSENYRVYGFDLRNHGKSPHTPEMGYDKMAGDVIGMMNKLEIESAHFVGHSMGGKTSMQVALNNSHRVNKLCVLDIAPVAYDHHHTQILKGMRKVTETEISSRDDVIKILSSYEKEPAVLSFLATNWRRNSEGRWDLRLNLDAIETHYQQIVAGNSGTPYNGDTLFVRGGESDYVLPEHRERVLSLFPKASVRTVGGAGHWLHAEKPDMVQRIVKRFLDGV
ncbi:alpha/beta fold hydrolase [Temperatibacter marinus]|uniref:Alpha/beta fold hydrolase n=1 Tax=Temperatibacter marinus TaxID=1456591 RepID=A0AA52H9G6_9PROT|nr:alpha/beta fold hydrolase [Temperatibacter marinus]WND02889.1 alpha/beta fold hydrolase [Temperatibacter marinus]